jgi:hypothetical protein
VHSYPILYCGQLKVCDPYHSREKHQAQAGPRRCDNLWARLYCTSCFNAVDVLLAEAPSPKY